jgi:hypothetical protein
MALQSRVILLGSVVINAPSVADYHCSIAEHGASIVRLRNLQTLVIDSPVYCDDVSFLLLKNLGYPSMSRDKGVTLLSNGNA